MDSPDGDKDGQRKKETANRITRAPKPATSISGTGGWRHPQRRTEVPSNPPANFPEDLWLKTVSIFGKARTAFPDRTHTLELCKRVISEMTPLYCDVVKNGTMKASAVLRERFGGMPDLLHSLLVCNDDGPHSGLASLSDGAYRLWKEAMNSDEWSRLVEALEDSTAEPGARPADRKSTNRRAMVDAYIQEVRQKKGKRITRKDFWTAAGYKARTEFERWERQDAKRPNQTADDNFSRVLREKPHLR
jgi:hypothetical protein